MKKKHRKKKQARPSLVGFVLLGAVYDVLRLVSFAIRIVAWPVNKATVYVHRELKKHPTLKVLHNRKVVCVSLGSVLLIVSFAIEAWSEHYAWKGFMEIVRAAGACPIWDSISSVTKIDEV